MGGERRGYDGGKKVNGRKRQVLVDTEGLVVKAKVHSAKVADQDGLKLLLKSAEGQIERLFHIWLDSGYQGRGAEWARQELGLSVEVVHRSPKPDPRDPAACGRAAYLVVSRAARRRDGRTGCVLPPGSPALP